MRKAILVWGAVLMGRLVVAGAQVGEVTLCAKAGKLKMERGAPVAVGDYLLPSAASVHRQVQFQPCRPDGRTSGSDGEGS